MTITARLILIIIAIVCFGIAAAGVPSRVNLMALGLALWAMATVIS